MDDILNIAICEDTIEEEQTLISMLDQSSISNKHTVFHSGEDLLDIYQPDQFDLLLIDIFMGGINGIDTITQIRKIDEHVPVAFITTSTDYTLESYRLSALKYIEKPYTMKEVEDILTLALLEKQNAPGLIVHKNRKDIKLRFSKIVYIETTSRHLDIHMQDGTVMQVNAKLSELLPQLAGQPFVSPHKSYSVNLAHVHSIDLELKSFKVSTGEYVPIRREWMRTAKKELENYRFARTRELS